jgi:hypothetical protein
MANGFDKDFLPAWCERCDKQGYFFVEDILEPCLVVCGKCGWEALSVWCPKCEAGFALPNEVGERPLSWSCPVCYTEYTLPPAVYEQTVSLYLEEDLPENVRARVTPPRKSSKVVLAVLVAVVVLVVVLYLVLRQL